MGTFFSLTLTVSWFSIGTYLLRVHVHVANPSLDMAMINITFEV